MTTRTTPGVQHLDGSSSLPLSDPPSHRHTISAFDQLTHTSASFLYRIDSLVISNFWGDSNHFILIFNDIIGTKRRCQQKDLQSLHPYNILILMMQRSPLHLRFLKNLFFAAVRTPSWQSEYELQRLINIQEEPTLTTTNL